MRRLTGHMQFTLPPHRVLVAILLAVAVVATACSSDPTAIGEPTPAGAPTTPPDATAGPGTTPSPATPGPAATATPPPVPVPTYIDENGFDDHTVPTISSDAEFFALSKAGAGGLSVVKFQIPDLPGGDRVHWLDSSFYALHDEWYWFRLLNGQPVPNVDVLPIDDESFATIDEVYRWAASLPNDELPLDLAWVDSTLTEDDRLYSPHYYEIVLRSEPRRFGVGSVVHVPEGADGDLHWLVELEFSDDPTPEEVARFIDVLAATLPPSIGDRLEWVVRSPDQEQTAVRMEAEGGPHADRIARYSEIIPAGDVAVYNEGIAAGRLLLVDGVEADLTDATDNDIVLVENVPDDLPPASALLTSSPQTPLAHVNLLARNRGIPNASVSGLLDDPGIRQAARIRAHAIVRATSAGELDIVLIDRNEYDDWLDLQERGRIAVPQVDLDDIAVVVDLARIDIDDARDTEAWLPVIGGKAVGMRVLLDTIVETPLRPLALTVKPYFEHLDQVEPALDAMLGNADFQQHAWARYLLLEGEDDFRERYTGGDDIAAAEALIAANPEGTILGDVLGADGFKRYFRDEPIDGDTLVELTDVLADAYRELADSQGLRFRSSASVEDIEGFTGAGLYDSNTGFLDPDQDERGRSVEEAIKKTWASYWSFEAFEERRRENVDHRSGGMGVLVHPRFDDELEINNGVATVTLLPATALDETAVRINVQRGAVSVTNPEAGELPEVIEARRASDGSWDVARISPSTLGGDVMTVDAVEMLAAQVDTVARVWRENLNAALRSGQEVTVVTLDIEFKTMAPGWPALDDGERPGGLIIKQARSLDPGLRDVPEPVLDLDIPRDVLARALLVERLDCRFDDGSIERSVTVLTDPLLAPDVGHGTEPFVVGGGQPPSDNDCDRLVRSVLYATPDQFLVELLEGDDLLDLVE